MGTRSPRPVTLDAGALVAIERGDERIRAALELSASNGIPVYVPAPVLVEVWRGGVGRQARLAAFLRRGHERGNVQVPALDESTAMQVGVFRARAKATGVSVADATVAWSVLHFGSTVFTNDPHDLQQLVAPDRIRVI